MVSVGEVVRVRVEHGECSELGEYDTHGESTGVLGEY